jgi:hypothetical protein
MSNFPLYDNLVNKISEKKLTPYQKNKLLKQFEFLETEQHELIYVLIKTYENLNCKLNNMQIFPFDIVSDNNELNININNLPPKLQQILYKFINTHIKSLNL